MIHLKLVVSAFLTLGLVACASEMSSKYQPKHFEANVALAMLEALSSDEMNGRKVGTEENANARAIIVERLMTLGAQPSTSGFEVPFTYGSFVDRETGADSQPGKRGVNVVGYIPGAGADDISMIMTAHYDHVGIIDGAIYNGADDNASGVVGLLAAAEYFAQNPPTHDIWFVALDAEEDGLGGAIAFVSNPPSSLDNAALNINFDMLSRGDNGKLWASGTSHWPQLKPIVSAVASVAPVNIEMGFDEGDGREDWTLLSDHAAFFRAGIPHIYFGVEDHPDYHKPGDDFEKIDQSWYLKSIDSVIMMAIAMDAQLPEIYSMRQANSE